VALHDTGIIAASVIDLVALIGLPPTDPPFSMVLVEARISAGTTSS
jgi:hypothetical protein